MSENMSLGERLQAIEARLDALEDDSPQYLMCADPAMAAMAGNDSPSPTEIAELEDAEPAEVSDADATD
jgi:hypothetical protein